ncbi:MAG TPA: amidase [Verrucomicrobiae bacterium]|nr:amidase [Verrucomicrobiae bacterium]
MTRKKEIISSLFSINQIAERIKVGEVLPTDLIEICLERVKKLNPSLCAFITINDEELLYNQAERVEKDIKQGNYKGPLHGIPFSIKDIFFAKGVKFTAGSRIFNNQISDIDSPIVKTIKDNGAILIGCNNLNEFASGITGKNPFYGNSKNPWDQRHISGGSSGGSAVAVATRMSMFSITTDTGGSTRVPSSLCGVIGVKPTYNLLNKQNVFPLSPTLDHVGYITNNAKDATIVIEYLYNKEYNNKNPKFSHLDQRKKFERKLIAGIPKGYFLELVDSEVENIFYAFLDKLPINKIKIQNIRLKNTEKYYCSWKDIRLSEASLVHEKWMKLSICKYSDDVRNMLDEGTKILAIDYIRSLNIIKEISQEFSALLNNKVDIIIVPTTIIPAPKLEEETIRINDYTTSVREALLRNTIVFNSIGLPSISIPIGLTKKDRLPVGLQLIGPKNKDVSILDIAGRLESIVTENFNHFYPPISI